MTMTKFNIFLIIAMLFAKSPVFAAEQQPIFVDEDKTAGFVRYVYIVMDDQVGGGCWTNVDSVKAKLRLALERDGIGVLNEAPAFYSPAVVVLAFQGLGVRADSGVCAGNFSLDIGRYSSSRWGGDYGTTPFNFSAWHEFWSTSTIFISGQNHNSQVVEFAEGALTRFLGDYFAAKRSDEVALFYEQFPKLEEEPLSWAEFKKSLAGDVE
ncbi:hypothetical protein [Celeribacter halophilus]|uniref:hypothetical protein n=1 Tax=Celeribacter halophilus TaxID=576117 RepID=UPI003A90B321